MGVCAPRPGLARCGTRREPRDPAVLRTRSCRGVRRVRDPVQARYPDRPVVFLALAPHDLHYTVNAELWVLSLTGTWTDRASDNGLEPGLAEVSGVRAASTQVEKILRHDPRQLVAIGPDYFDAVRAVLPPGLRDRLLTWS